MPSRLLGALDALLETALRSAAPARRATPVIDAQSIRRAFADPARGESRRARRASVGAAEGRALSDGPLRGFAPAASGETPATPSLARSSIAIPPKPLAAVAAALALWALPAASDPDPSNWPSVLEEARGQTVYWHAWGGSPQVNDYIAWAGERVSERHGVTVEHVKLADTADAVSRVLAEKEAGRGEGGAVDLIWINGENFAAMKAEGLLWGPWVEALPNWPLVDVEGKPGVLADFTVPTDGLEAPWSMAQLVFYHDAARAPEPPRSIPALVDWARENPGRFAYPAPPDFLGATFLKQALIALIPEPDALDAPPDPDDFARLTAPLWETLDALHPHLWRSGRAWPRSGTELKRLMGDGETDLAFSFNPYEAAGAIAAFQLPETVRTYVLDGGTIGNASFVAIPFNASARAGALVLANFLLSPEAQARKADPAIWGAPTVLDLDALSPDERAAFEAIAFGPGAPEPGALGRTLPEPHPAWMTRLEEAWARRYGAGR